MHHTLLPTFEDDEPIQCSLLSFLEQVIYPIPIAFWMEGDDKGGGGYVTTDDLETATRQRLQDDPKPWTKYWEANLQNNASIKTFELCKHRSWTEWYHEFVVLTIIYEGQDYLIHINRAWAAPDGWRQYIPPITWGSQKPSNDEVAIYRRGKWETAARHNTYVVASFDFPPTLLGTIYDRLLDQWDDHPDYSLSGANCWAFSRSLALIILYAGHSTPVLNGFIVDGPGPASRGDLLQFLRSGGPWAFISTNSVHKVALYERLLYQADFILEALLHGFKFYRHIRGDSDVVGTLLPSKNARFQRNKGLSVSSSGDIEDGDTGYSGSCSGNEIPHSLGPFGLAYDDPAVPPINSSCHAGGFLYLLTPPLIPPAEPAKPHFQVSVCTTKGDGDRDTGEPAPWLELGLVRHDGRGGNPRIVGRRTLPAQENPDPDPRASKPVFNFAGYLEEFRPNDVMGVWVCGPPTDVSQWSMTVLAASISLIWMNVFRESRRLPARASPPDLPGDSPHAAATSLWDIWPFNGPRSRLEFGRMKDIYVAFPLSWVELSQGRLDCTRSGVPHSFNRCGLAFDLEVPMYPTTLCQPGDFLYLLTPPIHLAPKNYVLSVTVYTWAVPGRYVESVASLPLSFEVGAVQSAARRGLEPIGPRYEVSTDPSAMDVSNLDGVAEPFLSTRHRHRMDDNHAFVRNLKAGDMIGLWVLVRDPSYVYMVNQALIVVETGPEVGMVGRYVHFVCDEIREAAVNIDVPRWAPAVGAVALVGVLFAGFSRAFGHW